MPLTAEQFKKLKDNGFSTEKIAEFETKRAKISVPNTGRDAKLAEANVIAPDVKPSFMDTAVDTYGRAGMGAYDALKWIPGVKQLANIVPGKSADEMSENIAPGNIGQQIVRGTGSLAGTLPFAAPVVKAASMVPFLRGALAPVAGFAGFEGGKKAIEGKPGEILPAALQGAASGAAFGAGGKAGSLLPIPAKVGSSIGMGAAGAAMAPEGERVSNFMLGAGLGITNPVNKAAAKTREQLVEKHADVYRQVLAPSKGDINRVEIRSGKNLDDYYKLAAKEGIIIKSSKDGKLDTEGAREQLQQKSTALNQQVERMLSSDKSTQFNLKDIAKDAKKALRNTFKNDADYLAAQKMVDSEIDASIQANKRRTVNGAQLNRIKQGMWSKGYEPLNPNSNKVAREIGFTIKDAIEKAYPDQAIKDTNAKLGEYLTLDALLDSAHGRVVQKGKLGRYAAQVLGGAAGMAVPGVGPLVGGYAGGKVSDFMNNPERITSGLSRSAKPIEPIEDLTNMGSFRSTSPEGITRPTSQPVLNKPLADFNPIKSQAMPEFKRTGEAIEFGKQAASDSNKISLLEKGLKDATDKAAVLRGKESDAELQEGMKQATRAQFYREALEAAKGAGKKIGLAVGFGSAALLASGQAGATGNQKDVDMNKIYQIESSGNPKAFNKGANAIGLGQITPIVLKEWNNMNKQKHTSQDLYDKNINMKIADWYMNKRIPQMLKSLKLPDTIKNRIISYNAGVSAVKKNILPKETYNYIQKYNK